MKKTSAPKPHSGRLRADYRLDYRESRPNRFASHVRDGSIAVVLEPDVASVFRSSKDVNALLRSVISSYPRGRRKALARKRTV
jgi:hypothetical protein